MSFQRGSLYSSDRRFVICETQEERDALLAQGWTEAPTYPHGEARWVERFDQITFDRPEPAVPEEVRRGPGRPRKV